MTARHPTRRMLLGVGLDGAGLGPESSDGQTRVTRGDDYVLMGGSETTHAGLQHMAETVAETCRDEGTSIGEAPQELLHEILQHLGGSDGNDARR